MVQASSNYNRAMCFLSKLFCRMLTCRPLRCAGVPAYDSIADSPVHGLSFRPIPMVVGALTLKRRAGGVGGLGWGFVKWEGDGGRARSVSCRGWGSVGGGRVGAVASGWVGTGDQEPAGDGPGLRDRREVGRAGLGWVVVCRERERERESATEQLVRA